MRRLRGFTGAWAMQTFISWPISAEQVTDVEMTDIAADNLDSAAPAPAASEIVKPSVEQEPASTGNSADAIMQDVPEQASLDVIGEPVVGPLAAQTQPGASHSTSAACLQL